MFPPEAYSRAGSPQPHWALPISTWATQWFTPTMGTPSEHDSALAAVAATLRQGPRPGPMEKDIRPMSWMSTPALSRAPLTTAVTTSEW